MLWVVIYEPLIDFPSLGRGRTSWSGEGAEGPHSASLSDKRESPEGHCPTTEGELCWENDTHGHLTEPVVVPNSWVVGPLPPLEMCGNAAGSFQALSRIVSHRMSPQSKPYMEKGKGEGGLCWEWEGLGAHNTSSLYFPPGPFLLPRPPFQMPHREG